MAIVEPNVAFHKIVLVRHLACVFQTFTDFLELHTTSAESLA